MYCGYVGNQSSSYIHVFDCRDGHGRFVPVDDLRSTDDPEADDASWTKVRSPKKPLTVYEIRDTPTASAQTPVANGFHAPAVAPVPWLTKTSIGKSVPTPQSTAAIQRQPQAAPTAELQPPAIHIGDKAYTFCGEKRLDGTVKYVGPLHSSPGEHVGLLLVNALGELLNIQFVWRLIGKFRSSHGPLINRLIDWLIDWLIDGFVDLLFDGVIDWLIDWLF